MKIAICGSIVFSKEMGEIAKGLKAKGHEVHLPFYAMKILKGEVRHEDFMAEKEKSGDAKFREEADVDLIKRYFKLIDESDAVLVLNPDKKGVKNYIGGNTLIEMGFAYVLDKKIFLYNPIPDMGYTDEIKAMKPIILDKDLSKIDN
jgi:nucleoside 2-deoxyribosyltransferase